MRNSFINKLIEVNATNDNFFIISGDAGLGVFDKFQVEHPDKFRNLGIAEQNTIGFAVGMALANFDVYVYNIIPFVLYRCYEQVRNDICYQNVPITLIGIGSGITYAPGGMTHYAIEDIGIAQTLPNLQVISPIDPIEAQLAAEYSYKCNQPLYIRLPKSGEPIIHKNKNFDITKPQIISEGEDVAIIFHGSISNEVIDTAEQLHKQNLYPKLISIPMIQPLNFKILRDMLTNIKHVVVVEEHFQNCGLGNIIMQKQLEYSQPWELHCMGIPFAFIHNINHCTEMRKIFKISAADIAAKTIQLFNKI